MTTDYERKAIERCVMPVQMAIDALSLPPREEEPEADEDEGVMFWPDGAKTRNRELEEDWQ